MFYFNNKGLEIVERFDVAMSMIFGKQLTYAVLTRKEIDLNRFRY